MIKSLTASGFTFSFNSSGTFDCNNLKNGKYKLCQKLKLMNREINQEVQLQFLLVLALQLQMVLLVHLYLLYQ